MRGEVQVSDLVQAKVGNFQVLRCAAPTIEEVARDTGDTGHATSGKEFD